MKNNWWSVLLVGMGIVIAVVSFYSSWVVGVMSKMGILNEPSENMFKIEQLMIARNQGLLFGCVDTYEVWDSLKYYLSSEEDKIELGWDIGRKRIGCGIEEVISGKGDMGVYRIIRGVKYWENSLMISEKSGECRLINYEDVLRLGRIVNLAQGSAKVEVARIEERIRNWYQNESDRCIDQRQRAN